jgi:hypothetical protein
MIKKLCLAVLILRGALLIAQKADPAPFANSINVKDLRAHLSVLTSDSLEGRETGTEGNYKAANYIARYFESLGLPKVGENKTYFQRMVYTNEAWNNAAMQINEHSYRHLYNFYAYPGTNPMVEKPKT